MYLGDWVEDSIHDFKFSTWDADGDPITLAGSPVASVYKGNGTTESTAGVTLTVDFDGRTGSHHVRIDTAADAFYAVANDYQVLLTAGTVDGKSVNGVMLAAFSIENRFREADLVAINGDAQSAADLKDFADAGYDPATNKVQGVVLTDTVTTYTGNTPQTGDAFARLGAPAGASVSEDIAAIEAQTDDIGAAGAGLTAVPWNAAWDAEVQSEVADALGVYDPPTHAELVAEIDAVQADVAGVQSDTNDIQARLPAALVAGRMDSHVGAMAANVIDNAALADDAIDSSVLAATAITEIQAGLALQASVDDLEGRLTAGRAALLDNLDAAVSTRASQTSVDDLPTNAELATALAAADDAVLAAIAALNNLSAAQVNAEVVDALATDSYAEIASIPAAATNLATMIRALYAITFNELRESGTTQTLRDRANTATIGTASASDDGTTAIRGSFA